MIKTQIIEGNTYAETVSKLQNGERPTTVKELAQARLDEPELFNLGFDTCTAIAYGKDSFKIIPISKELLNLSKDFRDSYVKVDYKKIKAKEIKIDNTFNRLLTKEEVLSHKGWLALFEGDKELLKRHADKVFENKEMAMGFWIYLINNSMRAVYVINLDYNSDANGGNNLDDSGRFLRVAPVSKKISNEAVDLCGIIRPNRKTICQLPKGHKGSHRAVIYWE